MQNPQPGEWTSERYSQGRIASYKPFNFVDGEGVRNSLYVSGCLFACPGCFNRAAQSFRYGQDYTYELEEQILTDLKPDYVQGLTLLGGEPFLNTGILIPLIKKVRRIYGNSKDIWSWTGYTWEEMMLETSDKRELLSLIDVLVDGRFELAKKDLTLTFRGSSNQRIIRVPESLEKNKIILWESQFEEEKQWK